MYVCLIVGFVYAGSTVKLGKYTFFDHVRAIWHTEQVQDLKTGVEDKAKPAVDKLKRGGAAAYDAIRGEPASGSGSDAGSGDGSNAGPKAGITAHAGSAAMHSGSAARSHRAP